MTTVSAAELGKLFKVTPSYVRKLAQSGVIPAQVRPGEYDLAALITAYVKHLERRKANTALASERLRLVAGKADIVEAQRDRMRDDLLPRHQVERVWTAVTEAVRSRFHRIPGTVTARLGMAQSPAETQAVVGRDVYDALADIAATQLKVTEPH